MLAADAQLFPVRVATIASAKTAPTPSPAGDVVPPCCSVAGGRVLETVGDLELDAAGAALATVDLGVPLLCGGATLQARNPVVQHATNAAGCFRTARRASDTR